MTRAPFTLAVLLVAVPATSGGAETQAAAVGRGSTGVRAAICYAGHLRSFFKKEIRQNHIDNFLIPLHQAGISTDVFMAVGRGDCTRSYSCSPGSGEWELATARGFRSEAKLSSEVEVMLDPEKEALVSPEKINRILTSECPHLTRKPWSGWGVASLWARVRNCYSLVVEKERSHGFKYDLIIRLRPDNFFIQPSDPKPLLQLLDPENTTGTSSSSSSSSSSSNIITPPHVFVGNGGVNDWAAACRREHCAGYFRALDLWERCVPPPKTLDMGTRGNTNASDGTRSNTNDGGKRRGGSGLTLHLSGEEEWGSEKVCCVGLGGSMWLDLAWSRAKVPIGVQENADLFPITIAKMVPRKDGAENDMASINCIRLSTLPRLHKACQDHDPLTIQSEPKRISEDSEGRENGDSAGSSLGVKGSGESSQNFVGDSESKGSVDSDSNSKASMGSVSEDKSKSPNVPEEKKEKGLGDLKAIAKATPYVKGNRERDIEDIRENEEQARRIFGWEQLLMIGGVLAFALIPAGARSSGPRSSTQETEHLTPKGLRAMPITREMGDLLTPGTP